MTEKSFILDYWFDEEDGKLHLTIYRGTEIVHVENIPGDFKDEDNIKQTCLEAASSHGFSPTIFRDFPPIPPAPLPDRK